MIKKLKMKFIALTMISLLVLLAVLVAGMNIINYNSVVAEADSILSLLSQNKGAFPEFDDFIGNRFPHDLSPELAYESRYFSVLYNHSGNIIYVDTSRISAVDTSEAMQYALKALISNSDRGFIDAFRYSRSEEELGLRITFLDCGRRLDSFYTFLTVSIGMALAGLLIVFFVVFFCAGRIIRPISESYEKQKRFITDAGHEIKTPLTIINANVDVLEMDLGENEYLTDIQLQTKRLTALTNDLVMLARMEEAETSMPMIEFPISDVISDTAMPFHTLADMQGKVFSCNIQPLLSAVGNAKAIEKLTSLLLDNALKYSPAGGTIHLAFAKQAKNLILTLENTTAEALSPENLHQVFDRFYRGDPSRNSETGGYGIGLSVAKVIVTAHGGKIQASLPEPKIFKMTVSLSANG